jgi:N-acyl amino acid synthase of PEP-CTERM/exosortase system
MDDNLIESFNEYFEMVPAVSDELKYAVYKLRFQVYCTETGFLNPERYPGGLEYDEYDDTSIHYLVRHRKSGIYAATTRLIMFNGDNRDKLFPMESHSRIDNFEVLKRIPRAQLGEVSRFCVSKEFKRRRKELGTVMGIGPDSGEMAREHERRTFPHITIALIASLIKISEEYDIHYWYAAMEPALFRFLAALGINFTGIGPLTDYHGKRQPCIIEVHNLLAGMANKNPGLWTMMTNRGRYLGNIKAKGTFPLHLTQEQHCE